MLTHVREKHGSLRFHAEGTDEEAGRFGLAEWAERKDIARDSSNRVTIQKGCIERFHDSCRSGLLDMHVFRVLDEVHECTEPCYELLHTVINR